MLYCIDTIEKKPALTGTPIGWWRRTLRVVGIGQVRSEAPAMMMATRDIGPLICKISDRIHLWQERAQQRRRLMALDDRVLRDIGVSRADAEREYRKPFWR